MKDYIPRRDNKDKNNALNIWMGVVFVLILISLALLFQSTKHTPPPDLKLNMYLRDAPPKAAHPYFNLNLV